VLLLQPTDSSGRIRPPTQRHSSFPFAKIIAVYLHLFICRWVRTISLGGVLLRIDSSQPPQWGIIGRKAVAFHNHQSFRSATTCPNVGHVVHGSRHLPVPKSILRITKFTTRHKLFLTEISNRFQGKHSASEHSGGGVFYLNAHPRNFHMPLLTEG